jgi:hypothetical protein
MTAFLRPLLICAVLAAGSGGLSASAFAQQGQAFMMQRADGTIFVDAGNGDAKHAATGFVCPERFNGVARRAIYVFDPSDGGREFACGYGRPNSDAWYTLNFHKTSESVAKGMFEDMVRQEKNSAPPKADAKAPLPAGLPPLPTRAAFWVAPNDQIDGLWFASIGPWQVDLRATYSAGHEDEVSTTAKAVWTQVFDEVMGPDI